MAKRILIAVCGVILAAGLSLVQGGIYSIIDPEGASLNDDRESTLGKVIGDTVKDLEIIAYYGGWENETEAREQLLAKLRDKTVTVFASPRWNMDIPVELIGIIKFKGGTTGKIAVARHRVGFQDKRGKPWYFQWDERFNWEKKSTD